MEKVQAPYKGAPMNSILFIELCAGCARLSANVAARGMQTLAVDQACNRHKQCHPTISLDLANDESVKYLLTLLKQPGRVFFIHAAPPCGTSSRARERKLSKKLRRKGVKEPQPLRSLLWPQGLPHLQGLDLKRVQNSQ